MPPAIYVSKTMSEKYYLEIRIDGTTYILVYIDRKEAERDESRLLNACTWVVVQGHHFRQKDITMVALR